MKIVKRRLENTIRDLSNLKQCGQLTANQREVLRACLDDLAHLRTFVSQMNEEGEVNTKLRETVGRISLWLFLNGSELKSLESEVLKQ